MAEALQLSVRKNKRSEQQKVLFSERFARNRLQICVDSRRKQHFLLLFRLDHKTIVEIQVNPQLIFFNSFRKMLFFDHLNVLYQ